MRTLNRSILIGIMLITGSASLFIGCSIFERDNVSPTEPETAATLSNYWGSHDQVNELQVFVPENGQGLLSVGIPAPATNTVNGYRLTYQIADLQETNISEFTIDFETTSGATLCIGLKGGDVLKNATLYPATFSGDPLLTDGPVRLYGFPWDWSGWKGENPPKRIAPRLVTPPVPLYDTPQDHEPVFYVAKMKNQCSGGAPRVVPTVEPTATPTVKPPSSYTISFVVLDFEGNPVTDISSECFTGIPAAPITVQAGDSQSFTFPGSNNGCFLDIQTVTGTAGVVSNPGNCQSLQGTLTLNNIQSNIVVTVSEGGC